MADVLACPKARNQRLSSDGEDYIVKLAVMLAACTTRNAPEAKAYSSTRREAAGGGI
jgi:hypothetical protein